MSITRRPAPGAGAQLPGALDRLAQHLVELAHVTEAEGAQEGAEGGGRHRLVTEQSLAAAGPQHVGVIARVGVDVVALDPFAQGLIGDPEVLGDLADRLSGALNETDRLGSELRRVGRSGTWHFDLLPGALCSPSVQVSTKAGQAHYRALHTAGRLAFHARRATLRLERRWP